MGKPSIPIDAIHTLKGLAGNAVCAFRKNGTAGELAAYALNASIIFIVLYIGFGLSSYDLTIPFIAEGDAFHLLTAAKAILEQGWWWQIDRLSAPFELKMILAPLFGHLDTGIIWVLSLFMDSPGRLVNTFYLLTFLLTGSCALWVLREHGINRSLAIFCSVLFALSPFAFYRGTAHLMLTTYTVPFVIGFSYRVITGTFSDISFARRAVYYVSAVILGLNYVYMAFFSCFIILVSLLMVFARRMDKQAVWSAGKFICIVLLLCVVNYAPSSVHWREDPQAKERINQKDIVESEVYALKIRHLFLPVPGHKFEPLARLEKKMTGLKFQYENENNAARLGAVGAFGFLLLIGAGLVHMAPGKRDEPSTFQKIAPLSALTLAAVLLATVGGFGSIFNIAVAPDIRTYNRISPYIHFMSLFGLAIFFHEMATKTRRWVYYPAILVVLVLAILDQTPFQLITRNFKASSNTATSVTQLTARMEFLLGQNALVYQLPFLSYPHTPKTNLMISHEHLAGYVFSKTLKWSWPALSTDTVYMNRSLAKLDSSEFIQNLAILGFDSIWIDRRAYKDKGKELSWQLQIEGVIPLVSNETIIVLDMRKAKHKFQNQYSAEQKSAMRDRLILYGERPVKPGQLVSGQTISFTKSGYSNDFIGEGWSVQERDFRWTEGHRAEINIYLKNHDGHDVMIVMDAGAFVTGSHEQPLELSANGKVVGKFLFTAKKSRQKIRAIIPAGLIRKKDNYIQLILAMNNPVSPYELGLSKDERILGIQVRSLQILPKNKKP